MLGQEGKRDEDEGEDRDPERDDGTADRAFRSSEAPATRPITIDLGAVRVHLRHAFEIDLGDTPSAVVPSVRDHGRSRRGNADLDAASMRR
jgi:hypothetical protein